MATFVPFGTFLDSTFWSEVNKRKLSDWMLDESPRAIFSQLSLHDTVGTACRLPLNYESFKARADAFSIDGELFVYNTIENFKNADRNELVKESAAKIWETITTKEWLKNPSLLSRFFIISFADLKKFKYVYWTCVPALTYPVAIEQEVVAFAGDSDILFAHHQKTSAPVFLLKGSEILDVSHLEHLADSEDVSIVVADPSVVTTSAGWTVRNVLAAIAHLHPTWNSCRVISLRATSAFGFRYTWKREDVPTTTAPKAVGWERNTKKDKLAPYSVDLSGQFDPKKLMEQSVDLNLSLIKWRLVPDIKLERYSQLKVLVFGAGTLGCNIARTLMGWGVRKISFVDNSTVSYSNPVRQSLSEFEDARLGRGKAETAVAAMRRIFPTVEATAHRMTVPMPGHTVDEKEEAALEKDIEKLDQLVQEHDVLFLALDSREARWLPTVLANKHRKIAISVALGFDTYVIIRHGIGFSENAADAPSTTTTISPNETVPYSQLSCYFCNDVTAPGNSTADRTLDQQCTVSRPGLSMTASGIAVELLSSVLQCPKPIEAPANMGEPDDSVSVLGAVPHQIRGFVSRFQQNTYCVKRYDKCTACGGAVGREFEENGWKFVRDVMNSPSRLEQVAGLTELQNSVQAIDIEFDDDEDDF